MKLRLLAVSVATLAAIAAACDGGGGGGGGGGGFGDNGGSGTQTLNINASITVEDGLNFASNIAVRDAVNSAVAAASVTLTTPAEELTLTELTPGLGFYSTPAGAHAYGAGFRLDIVKDGDNARDIGIAAPTLTGDTVPASQTNITRNQDTILTWTGRGADEFRVEMTPPNNFDSGWIDGDTGSYTITAAMLTTAAIETMTIRRRKTLPITAGRPGSQIQITLEDTVGPIAVVP